VSGRAAHDDNTTHIIDLTAYLSVRMVSGCFEKVHSVNIGDDMLARRH
jgi:hypothetical protein